MKAEFIARLGMKGEIVAYIDPLPYGYLMIFKDGRRIPGSSLQEFRDAGYTIEAKR